ncbi:MAG: sorbosone dehydrogenase family protein [Gammaproteobacteria bacterium]|nr:sorbosone dehydrogenase family protein [Gammaproteobacteria bacterium]
MLRASHTPSLAAFALMSLLLAALMPTAFADLSRLRLPEGFSIRILSAEAPDARQMALSADGTLFVGTRRHGDVYAIPNALTAQPPKVLTLASGLKLPNGVALDGADLFVAEVNRVLRFRNIQAWVDAGGQSQALYEVVTDQLPDKTHHGWKYIKFGPDGQLYVPVGAPCNICLSEDPRFAALLRMDPKTGSATIYASGIRNTVGFAWHPATGELWFSDNGRDRMGDDIPPEEINVASRPGQHFGYPFLHGSGILDPRFGDDAPNLDFTPPRLEIQAHAAALGLDFHTHDQFPPPYRGALFIAEHGSWNRSAKVGYRVSVVTFEDGEPRYAPFITGWLEGERQWGRPVDVLAAPDGSLLVSDDQQGAIYQVTWED